STIRLYKRCVLPSRLWLPKYLQQYADDWDVCGLARLVAVDNSMDANAIHSLLMFMTAGAILLCMPPKRGDLKGSIERALFGKETAYVSTLPGYVPLRYRFTDPRQKRIKDRMKAQAKLTVREYEEFLLLAILEHNNSQHPRF